MLLVVNNLDENILGDFQIFLYFMGTGGLNTRVLEAKAYNHNCTQILSLRLVGIQVQTERQNLNPAPLLYQEEPTQVTYFYDPAPEETFWIELNDWSQPREFSIDLFYQYQTYGSWRRLLYAHRSAGYHRQQWKRSL